jgi:ATP-dependent Clp protease adaptor protein ClpS
MAEVAEPDVLPRPDISGKEKAKETLEPGYLVICWDDPINTMLYVTHVFRKVFGWNREVAEKRMLEVHNNGKSVLARESMEKAEYYVHQLQIYCLHATMEKAAA